MTSPTETTPTGAPATTPIAKAAAEADIDVTTFSRKPLRKRYPFTPYPNGWFIIAMSSEVKPGGLKPLRYFGRELVLYRTESGKPMLVDAVCPHLGGHLALGTVMGETIQCPFHNFRYDCSGVCVEAPFAKKIPPAARLKPWPIQEVDGVIVAFYDRDGNDPTWDIPATLGEGFSDPQCQSWDLRTHVIEMAENSVDATHAVTVHGANAPTALLSNDERGPVWQVGWRHWWPMKRALAQLNLGAKMNKLPPGFPEVLEIDYVITFHGLGYIHLAFDLQFVKYQVHYRVCSTPIDAETTELRSISAVRPMEGASPHIKPMVAGFIKEWTARELSPDFPIWESKDYLRRPALCDADGPFGKMRKWAAQFFPEGEGPLPSRA